MGTEAIPGGTVAAGGAALPDADPDPEPEPEPGPFGGGLAQAASNPKIAADSAGHAPGLLVARIARTFDMWVILLEAFGAMVVLILIVWWTMFAGRKRGERRDE